MVGIAPWMTRKGLAGPAIRAKKKPATTNTVSVAHPTSGSVARVRKWWTITAR